MRLLLTALVFSLIATAANAMTMRCRYLDRFIEYQFDGGDNVIVNEEWKKNVYDLGEWSVSAYDEYTQFVVAHYNAMTLPP